VAEVGSAEPAESSAAQSAVNHIEKQSQESASRHLGHVIDLGFLELADVAAREPRASSKRNERSPSVNGGGSAKSEPARGKPQRTMDQRHRAEMGQAEDSVANRAYPGMRGDARKIRALLRGANAAKAIGRGSFFWNVT
jgi:hypothetical protein